MRLWSFFVCLCGILMSPFFGFGQAPEPYVRIQTTDSNVVQLQIALRKFIPVRGKGPAVWLSGVSHIGESNYFVALQKHLDAQSLVLFEGVSGSRRKTMDSTNAPGSRPTNSPPASSVTNRPSLQSTMASSLGLRFQLEAIDYRRPNFRHSDLTLDQLREIIQNSGHEQAAADLDRLANMLEGGSFWDALFQLALRFLGSNPKLQALGRLTLIEMIGQIKGDPGQLGAAQPDLQQLLDVLIQRRNEKVLADLKSQLATVGRRDSISIFYGTGHMPDLEQRLRDDLKYRSQEQIWLTAFSVNLAEERISPEERAFIENLVKRQLDFFQSKSPSNRKL